MELLISLLVTLAGNLIWTSAKWVASKAKAYLKRKFPKGKHFK